MLISCWGILHITSNLIRIKVYICVLPLQRDFSQDTLSNSTERISFFLSKFHRNLPLWHIWLLITDSFYLCMILCGSVPALDNVSMRNKHPSNFYRFPKTPNPHEYAYNISELKYVGFHLDKNVNSCIKLVFIL